MSDSKYLELWKRFDKVVVRFTSSDRKDEAEYLMAVFFCSFDDTEELERIISFEEEEEIGGET